jgi:hypothetical protein
VIARAATVRVAGCVVAVFDPLHEFVYRAWYLLPEAETEGLLRDSVLPVSPEMFE